MQIIFNGKTYNSPEEMPANERQAFEQMQQIFVDANGNGIPDFMEGDMFRNVMAAVSNNVSYKGQVYNSLDELPADVREKVQKALDKMKQLGLVADVPNVQAPVAPFEPAFQPSKPLLSQESVVQEGGGKNWMIILGFLGAILLCALAFAIVMFLR
jgi:hypothetical protein